MELTSSEERIPSIPVFTRETLITMTVEQLKEICRKYNIKTGKTKEMIVDNILKHVATVHRSHIALETLRMRTKTISTPDPAIIHNFFCVYFSLVDIADRYWNEVEEHHNHQNWKFKVFLMILRFAVLNFRTETFRKSIVLS
jgi:hypothetical protein